jgi:activator of the mannose operon (transcriptional antiterminator)
LSVDEKHMVKTLNKYNLQLKRKDRTLAIIGTETNIRMALMESMDMLDVSIEKSASIPVNLEKKDMNFVNKQISIIEKTLNVGIPYPYNINIVSHLYILILRFRKHGQLSNKEINFSNYPDNFIERSYLRVCDIIIKNFESYLSATLPEMEKEYLYRYLTSYRVEYADDLEDKRNLYFPKEIEELADKFIDMMEKSLLQYFSNYQFRLDLMKHIKPMMNRLKNNIFIKNRLLDQIKFEYPETHAQTAIVSKNIVPTISEDEIGFLTLYFAREIERNPRKIKTLITCTTGIGTSELLRVKIEKIIPEIEIIDVISTDVIDDQAVHNIDLIVSTVAIKNFNLKPIIVVSAMFNKNDQEKVKKFIHNIGV